MIIHDCIILIDKLLYIFQQYQVSPLWISISYKIWTPSSFLKKQSLCLAALSSAEIHSHVYSLCLSSPTPHLASWLDEGECEGEIWGAIKGAWMGIIPRLKATTEDHVPCLFEGYRIQPSRGLQIMFPVICHVMAWLFCSFV